MGNFLDPEKKKKASPQPLQAKEETGKTLAPPTFSPEAGPMQLKGGWWDTVQSGIDWVAEQFGFGGETVTANKVTPAAETPAAEVPATAPVAEEKKEAAPVAPAAEEKKAETAKPVAADGLQDFEFKKANPKVGKEDWSGSKLTNLMLKEAGYDPASKWWDDFTSIKLLGKTAAHIHTSFARQLKNAELKIVANVTATAEYKKWVTDNAVAKPDDPASVGKFLGITGYATIRGTEEESSYASMHLFGLAIDFNYTQNPWISDDSGSKTYKDKDKKIPTSKTAKLQACLDRAGGLIGKTLTYNHVNADDFKYNMSDTYDNFSTIDKGVEQYFGLGKDDKDADLKALLDTTTDPFWKGKTTEEARKLIEADLKEMSALWSRKGQEEMIRTNGIMDLHKGVVTGMGDVGLDWGGKYGDMMHFDMRNVGLGKKIQASKYKGDVVKLKKELKEKEAAAAEEAKKKKAEEAAAKKAAAAAK